MVTNQNIRTACAAVLATSALAVASVSHAIPLGEFADDFQSYSLDPNTFGPWEFFSDNGGFGPYNGAATTDSGAIANLSNDGNGNQYINVFANYGNGNVHNNPPLQESISVFVNFTFTGDDAATGETWIFDFDYAGNPDAPVTGDTQVSAFIRVFDGAFNLLDQQVLPTLDATADFQSGQLFQELDPLWENGGNIQIGFNNLTGNFDGSGRFYDNVSFSVIPVPAAVWLFGSALGMLGWIRRKAS